MNFIYGREKRGKNQKRGEDSISRDPLPKSSLIRILPLLIFILNLTLISPEFIPHLFSINPHDEASYINNGKELAEGNPVIFAASPLSSFVYAPIYLLTQKSPFWFLQCVAVGRFLLFGLLWLGSYQIAKCLSKHAHRFIILGFLFVTPILPSIVHNQSDALFAAMSSFAFWQILKYYQEKSISHLWLSSLFVGLAALARSDGLVLFAIFLTLSVYLSLHKKKLGWAFVASFLPFSIIVGGYLLIYGLTTGTFEMGTARRAYDAFEQGHETVYSEGGEAWVEGAIEARKIYGTGEENQYSIFNAIKRNPSAFLDRFKQTIKILPEQILATYNKRIAPMLFLLAALGIWSLLKAKIYPLLLLILLWPATLFVYFLTFFRDGYLLTPYFIILLLASIGLSFLVDKTGWNKGSATVVVFLLGLILLSLATNKLAIVLSGFIFLFGYLIFGIIKITNPKLEAINGIGFAIFLCAGLILRGGFSFPNYPSIGDYPDEKALVYLTQTFEPGTRIGTYTPLNAWAAKLIPVNMSVELRSLGTPQEFVQWMHDEGVQAIYVEGALRSAEAPVWSLIQQEIGKNLKIGFTTGEDGIQVLVVNTTYDSD